MKFVKRLVVVLLIVCLLSVPILASYNGDTIVYVTRTGEKYHSYGCQYLHSSCIPIALEDAVLRYTPCSRCYPPRLTGNSSGNSGYTGGTGGGQSYTPSATPTPTSTPTPSVEDILDKYDVGNSTPTPTPSSDVADAIERIEQIREEAKNKTGNEHYDGLKEAGAPLLETAPSDNASDSIKTELDNAEAGNTAYTVLSLVAATGLGIAGTLIVMYLAKRHKNNSYTPLARYEPVHRQVENIEQVNSPPQAPRWEDIELFVCFTHSGNTYHRPSCRYAKGIKAPLSQVGNRRPCKVCRPPEKQSYMR